MTKKKFFEYYYRHLKEPVYLTDSIDDLRKEIDYNCWYITIPEELKSEITLNDISEFIGLIKEEYTKQLKVSGLNINLWFYLWIDEQAGQLRFNFINSNHKELPFRCKIIRTNNMEFIIRKYLDFSDLTDVEKKFLHTEYESSKFILNVYSEIINNSSQ